MFGLALSWLGGEEREAHVSEMSVRTMMFIHLVIALTTHADPARNQALVQAHDAPNHPLG